MKKIYVEPIIEIENIELDDVIATSVGDSVAGDKAFSFDDILDVWDK